MAKTDYMSGRDKHSRDFQRAKYLPAKKEPSYFENFDNIKWDKETKFATKAKGKKKSKNSTTEMLYIKETVNAARTPILERKGETGEKTFPNY